MAKYSIVMTRTPSSSPCRVAGCIISIRSTYSCAGALTYVFTYLHSWLGLGEYKTGNISETVDRANVTINGLYIKSYIHGLSIAAKMYDPG